MIIIDSIREFHNPHPQQRIILDAVSNFEAAIHASLKAGILRKRTFKIEFPRHVFKFLFDNKGTVVSHKPGKLYDRNDFNESYFTTDTFTLYNKHHEGFSVKFPIYMYSFVSFSVQFFDSTHNPLPRTYTETLFVKVVKDRC